MRNVRTSAAPAAARCVRPRGFTREPAGRKNSAMACPLRSLKLSIGPRLGRYRLHVVRERLQVHRPVVEPNLTACVHPDERVLAPVHIVALGKILARVRATALVTLLRGADGRDGLQHQVLELEGL